VFELSVEIDQQQLSAVKAALGQIPGAVRRAMVGALNDTAKTVRAGISKDVRRLVNIKKKDIDQYLKIKLAHPASAPSALVTVEKSARLPLKYFGARQNAAGVKYKISKVGKSKNFLPSGFMGPKPGAIARRLGGHVFKRVGTKRLPIRKQYGPSAWGVVAKNGLDAQAAKDGQAILRKNIQRRLNEGLLRVAGKIR